MPYIYLIHCRASVNSGENVYKIGKTGDFAKRMEGYDKGSIPLLSLYVRECDDLEKVLINKFIVKYRQRRDYGVEYFEGNVSEMIMDIMDNVNDRNLHYVPCSSDSAVVVDPFESKNVVVDQNADSSIIQIEQSE